MKKLEIKTPTPTDIEISQSSELLTIEELSKEIGLLSNEYEIHGKYRGKITLEVLERLKNQENGNYVLVTGINPTSFGEGKTTTSLGLSQSLGAHLNKKVFTCLRCPSRGPTFGIKGGASGGGYSLVVPMDEFNLFLPDIDAVSIANNLCAAAIDTRMFHESYQKDIDLFNRLCPKDKNGNRLFTKSMLIRLKKLGIEKQKPEDLTDLEINQFCRLNIDPQTITWKRVVDVSDRYLRKITVGQSQTEKGRIRETGFDIAVASEVMAILALANSLQDLRERIGRIVVARDKDSRPVTTEDLGVAGAMTVLLKDVIKPNLMQTIEKTPVLVHSGPFANIAHGNSSIIADKIALKLVGKDGYVVTEAGFGADCGAEKFFNIKCRSSGLTPNCCVIVCSLRALKTHGGIPLSECKKPNIEGVIKGCSNLKQHIENISKFGIPTVVCINQFINDTDEEIAAVITEAKKAGAFDAVSSTHYARGGEGAIQLATSVIEACQMKNNFKFLYELNLPIKSKIEIIAKEIYRADSVKYEGTTEEDIENFEKNGFGNLPICIAKTQYSFSHDPKLLGTPNGFVFPIREIRASIGAGFIFPISGDISTMPGLPTRPAYYDIDIDEKGNITGLF